MTSPQILAVADIQTAHCPKTLSTTPLPTCKHSEISDDSHKLAVGTCQPTPKSAFVPVFRESNGLATHVHIRTKRPVRGRHTSDRPQIFLWITFLTYFLPEKFGLDLFTLPEKWRMLVNNFGPILASEG